MVVFIILLELSPKNPTDSDKFIWYLFFNRALISTSVMLLEAANPLRGTTYPFNVAALPDWYEYNLLGSSTQFKPLSMTSTSKDWTQSLTQLWI
jgi:hypothetical protein